MKKVLSSIMALLLCVGIAGCGSNSENEKPKDEPTNETSNDGSNGEMFNEEREEIKLEKMSIEETKALKAGDRIDKFPDLNLLEQNAMAVFAGYQQNIYKEKDNGELELTESNLKYSIIRKNDAKIAKNSKYEQIIDGVKYSSDSTYNNELIICPIVDIYEQDNGDYQIELVAPDDSKHRILMFNQNNFDALKQTLGLTDVKRI